MEIFNARRITRIGVTAAIYVVVTFLCSSFAYGEVQLRISEALMLLCLFNSDFVIALVLGCFISNLNSPLGLMDVVFGTGAPLAAAVPMYLLRKRINLPVASLFPVVSNAFIVAWELKLVFNAPYWASAGWVALGGFVCVSILGVILIGALSRNKTFMRLIMAGSAEESQG